MALDKGHNKSPLFNCFFLYLKNGGNIVLLWLFPLRQQLGMLLIIGIFGLLEYPLWMFVRVNYFELK